MADTICAGEVMSLLRYTCDPYEQYASISKLL